MSVQIFRGFLSQDECSELNCWVELGVQSRWLDRGISRGQGNYQNRLTTRLYANRFKYPPIVEQIYQRIAKRLGLQEAPRAVVGGGRDGVVVSYTLNGGDVYEHIDPMEADDLHVLRCNVITQAPESGGKLFVNGEEISLQVGDLHCYLASKHPHHVTVVEGSTPRILWMFGWGVKDV